MKITLTRDALTQALAIVGRAVSSRASVQILAGILIDAQAEKVEFAATDMEVSIRASATAAVAEEGRVVVPGRLLLDIARLLPPGEVVLAFDESEGVVELTAGPSSYRLNTYSAEDYPRLPFAEDGELLTLDATAFLETVGRVSRAASRDESRPVLTGILVRLAGSKLVMAATDSYRLSVKETSLPSDTGQELDAIVPARALDEARRIATGNEAATIELGLRENQAVFRIGEVLLTARRIDGQFPNYEQLRPEGFEAELTLPREEFADAVRRVGVMAQRNAPIRLRFEEGSLTIEAQTQDVGEARESLPLAYSGDAIEIGFNHEFLIAGLESVPEDDVSVKLISPLRPGLISGPGDDFWYLIMPIRLAG